MTTRVEGTWKEPTGGGKKTEELSEAFESDDGNARTSST